MSGSNQRRVSRRFYRPCCQTCRGMQICGWLLNFARIRHTIARRPRLPGRGLARGQGLRSP